MPEETENNEESRDPSDCEQQFVRPQWSGTLTRKEALKILLNVTDKEDPAWEYATEDHYDEETDTMPSIWHVMGALGFSVEEVNEASGIQ